MSSPAPQRPAEQLDLFRALPGDMAPRDSQDLMAYPFFSLAKSRRVKPIDFRSGNVAIRVEGTQEHGIATIWDADILIWAASQIVEARDAGITTSRLMRARPYEILRFIGRGVSLRDYQRLKAALDRLQSTTVATSIRETTGRRLHRFSWINEWKELADSRGTPLGIELILPDWFYAGPRWKTRTWWRFYSTPMARCGWTASPPGGRRRASRCRPLMGNASSVWWRPTWVPKYTGANHC